MHEGDSFNFLLSWAPLGECLKACSGAQEPPGEYSNFPGVFCDNRESSACEVGSKKAWKELFWR